MDSGSIAWVLTSCALVLFMTPGLALFYGGMVRSKNVLSMLMKNFITIGIVSVVWSVVGFTIAFGTDVGSISAGSTSSASTAWRATSCCSWCSR